MTTVQGLFAKTWEDFKPRWRPLVAIMAMECLGRYALLLVAGIASLAVILGDAWSLAAAKELTASKQGAELFLEHLFPLLAVLSAWSLAMAVFEGWTLSSLFFAVTHPEAALVDSLAGGLKNLFGFGWILALLSAVVLAGFVCLLVPGLVFAFWFFLAPLAFYVDGSRGWSALSLSRRAVMRRPVDVGVALAALLGAMFVGLAIAKRLPVPFSVDLFLVVAVPLAYLYQRLLYIDLQAGEAAP